MHRWFGFQYLLALHAFCCECSWPTLWVSTNEHFQINTKPLCLSGLSHPSMSSKNVKLLWNDFVLMRPSPFVHIQSHLTEQWQKEDAIASCCCRTCKNSIAWGLGVQCGLLGTRWMLLCHTSQGTEITEVVWSFWRIWRPVLHREAKLYCAVVPCHGFWELVSRCQAGFAEHPFCCEYDCLTEKRLRATVSAGGVSSHLEQMFIPAYLTWVKW